MKAKDIDSHFFKTVIHQCSDLVAITDQNGFIKYANPAFEKASGYSLKYLKGKNISIVKSDKHKQIFYKDIWTRLNSGKTVKTTFINKRKDGELYYENKTITPIKNEKGVIVNFLSTSRDVTQDLFMQRKINKQNMLIEKIISNADVLVVGYDKKGRIVLFNEACERLTGYKANDVIGKLGYNFLVPKNERYDFKKIFNSIINKKDQVRQFEGTWITRKGIKLLIKWSNRFVGDPSEDDIFILNTGIDITLDRQREKELKTINENLDGIVKERTEEINKLNNEVLNINKYLNKINSELPALIYLIDLSKDKITILNNKFNNTVFFPCKINERISATKFLSFFRKDDVCISKLSELTDQDSNSEFKIIINDTYYYIDKKTSVFNLDEKGNPNILLGYVADISYTKKIQLRLEESQRMARIGTWEWNILTDEIYWSDEIYKIFDLKKGLFQPSYPAFLDKVHPADRPKVEAAVNNSLSERTPYNITHRLETSPGKVKFVIEKGYTEYDKKDKPVRMIGTVRDITEEEYLRKRMEESQDLAKMASWEFDIITEEFKITEQIFKIYEHEPIPGSMTWELLKSRIYPGEEHFVSSTPINAMKSGETYKIEYRIITFKNNLKYICARGYTEYDSKGKPLKILGTLQDITEEKMLRNKLLDYYTTLENSLNAVFTSDLKGNIEYANTAAFKMWGFDSREEMLRHRPHATDYWCESEKIKVIECIETTLIQGTFVTEIPFRALKKDGTFSYITFNVALIKDEHGVPLKMTAAFFDVTRQLQIEQEIARYDEKISRLLENIDEVVFGIDTYNKQNTMAGNVFYLSPKSVDLMGFSFEDIVTDPAIWSTLIHPDDFNMVEETNKECVIKKKTIIRIYRLKHRVTNEYHWFEERVTPYFGEKNELRALYGSARDVTKRIEDETKLKISEERYRLLSENNRDMITLRDVRGGAIFVSHSVKSLLGYTVEEYLATNLFDIMHPEDRERIRQSTFDPAFKGRTGGVTIGRVMHKDGYYKWVEVLTQPVYDEKGDVIHIVGSSRDITERRKLELALSESEEKYRSIFSNALVGIFRTNIYTQRALDANEACIKLMGYDSLDDLLQNFVASERYANHLDRENLLNDMKCNNIVSQKIQFKRKDDTKFWANVSAKLSEEGVLEGIIVDVTKNHEYEMTLQRNLQEKEDLLKEVHHRVKNNLQVVSSLLRLQSNKIKNPEISKPLNESIERIKTIALIH
ncbi:MAG: PAS domain S-box protein, partial [Bacteroidia bacterium]